jgi:glycosyltransferase involved in cell wall biosynthesis
MSATVLLPVYNGAATLPQALESILSQRHRDLELLVIDDASTDDSAAVIQRFARADSRVVPVLHERNAGLANTLNEGLERARHELVARMDQDDEALPDRLGTQSAFFEANREVAVAGSWVYHMGSQRRYDRLVRLPVEHDEIVARLASENCMYHPTTMLRRSMVLDAGGYRGEFKNAEDYDLWLRLARRHQLANVPAPLLRYRFSVDGMTLGRKWEQLFYVHLAQAAGGDPAVSLDEAERRAQATLAAVDRRTFLTQVAFGTVRELVALRHWRDAVAVTMRFAKDIGPRAAALLLAEIGRARVRERKSPALHRVLP